MSSGPVSRDALARFVSIMDCYSLDEDLSFAFLKLVGTSSVTVSRCRKGHDFTQGAGCRYPQHCDRCTDGPVQGDTVRALSLDPPGFGVVLSRAERRMTS